MTGKAPAPRSQSPDSITPSPDTAMYEVYCTVTDHQGSRVIPTGHAFHLEVTAWDCVAQLQRSYPDGTFWADYTATAYPY